MITYFTINDQGDYTPTKNLTTASWLHLEKASAAEMAQLALDYHFPLDYLTAVLDNQEISRFESHQLESKEDSTALLLLQYPKAMTSPSGFKQFNTFPFSIILIGDTIITACNDYLPLVEGLKENKNPAHTVPQQNQLPIQLAWYFSHQFNHGIKEIKKDTERLEHEIKHSTENKQLFELMDMQKSLIHFKASLEQNLVVFHKLHNNAQLMVTKADKMATFDVLIETKQAIASTDIQLDILGQLGSMFSAIVGNNMNTVMKTLTVITISLTIPTLIGGIYGMNVALPFQHADHAFWWLMLLIIALITLTIWLLKKYKFF